MARPLLIAGKPVDYFNDDKLIYTGRELEPLLDKLEGEVIQSILKSGTKQLRHRDTYRPHLSVILLNLYQCYRTRPELPLAISMNKTWYSHHSSLGYEITRHTVKALIREKYVIHVTKGYHKYGSKSEGEGTESKEIVSEDNPFVQNKTGTYRATAKLIKLFNDHKLNLYHVKVDLDRFTSLRAKEVELESGDKRNELVTNLRAINEFYDKVHIDLAISDSEMVTLRKKLSHKKLREEFEEWEGEYEGEQVLKLINFRRKYHHRVFNSENFDLHGRFYGNWYQNIPSEFRNFITIDNRFTAETDFSHMHFALLYAKERKRLDDKFEGDAYNFTGHLPEWKGNTRETVVRVKDKVTTRRTQIKLIMNYMLNCKSRKQVVDLIKTKRATFPHVPLGFDTWYDFVEYIEVAHSDLYGNFYTNKGIELMNIDSKIAEAVIMDLMAQGICCLTIHDSFLSQRQHQSKVMDAMWKHYKEITGSESIPLKLDSYNAGVRNFLDVDINDMEGYFNRLQEWNDYIAYYNKYPQLPLTTPEV